MNESYESMSRDELLDQIAYLSSQVERLQDKFDVLSGRKAYINEIDDREYAARALVAMEVQNDFELAYDSQSAFIIGNSINHVLRVFFECHQIIETEKINSLARALVILCNQKQAMDYITVRDYSLDAIKPKE